jgi:spore coat polysaccharide biosynthesis protein SpsF
MTLGRTGIIVAARTGSQRLPRKALLPLRGVPMLAFLLRRLQSTQRAAVFFATTELPGDDVLARMAAAEGVGVFRGANEDVVARYVGAAERFALDSVVRITADCPFVNAELVDYCLAHAARFEKFDIATTKTRFPVGLDAEIYHSDDMARLDASGQLTAVEREHLTLHYYNHADVYDVRYLEPMPAWELEGSHLMVDTGEDYERALRVADGLPEGDMSIAAVLRSATP